jgi:hypothetical protein
MRLPGAALAAMVSLVWGHVAFADDTIPGTYAVARTHPSGLVIWDSAPLIAAIVKNKTSDADANTLLQRDALLILSKTAPQFAASKDVKVRVLYSKTGDINPAYGSATFTGIERYAELVLTRDEIASDAGKWKEAAAGTGDLPAFTQLKILGTLPPR